MSIEEKALPTYKWIVVNDINRELSPIGYGFSSPIMRPSKFPIDTIGQLLNISKVTAMYEVYEDDHTLRVHLNNANFRKPFEEIWDEQNPNTPFPWAKSVEAVLNNQEPNTTTGDISGTTITTDSGDGNLAISGISGTVRFNGPVKFNGPVVISNPNTFSNGSGGFSITPNENAHINDNTVTTGSGGIHIADDGATTITGAEVYHNGNQPLEQLVVSETTEDTEPVVTTEQPPVVDETDKQQTPIDNAEGNDTPSEQESTTETVNNDQQNTQEQVITINNTMDRVVEELEKEQAQEKAKSEQNQQPSTTTEDAQPETTTTEESQGENTVSEVSSETQDTDVNGLRGRKNTPPQIRRKE